MDVFILAIIAININNILRFGLIIYCIHQLLFSF